MVDYACSYNGYSFGGAGALVQILDAAGLEDLPDMRSGDVDRPARHGQFPGLDVAGGRTVTMQVQVFPTSGSLATTIEAFKAVLVPQTAEAALTFTLPGRGARRIYCRPRRRAFPVDAGYDRRIATGAVEWHATDPRIYDDTLTTLTAAAPSGGVGTFTVPMVVPLTISFGAGTALGQVQPNNAGTVPAPWAAVLTGPLTDPRVENLTNGGVVQLVGTLAAGEFVTLDSLARTVTRSDGTGANTWVAPQTSWFDLDPGSSTVQIRAGAGSGTLALLFRSAWM